MWHTLLNVCRNNDALISQFISWYSNPSDLQGYQHTVRVLMYHELTDVPELKSPVTFVELVCASSYAIRKHVEILFVQLSGPSDLQPTNRVKCPKSSENVCITNNLYGKTVIVSLKLKGKCPVSRIQCLIDWLILIFWSDYWAIKKQTTVSVDPPTFHLPPVFFVVLQYKMYLLAGTVSLLSQR